MPSANKTQNYGLNQWQANEYPKRQDFVDDNAIIDEALKEIADAAANAASAAEEAQDTAEAAIPKSLASAANQALVSTAAGTWAVKTLSQFKTWLALTASNISDFAATVRSTALTGLSTATSAVITAADTVLGALGKLQAQITAHTGRTDNPHGVTAAQAGAATVATYTATLSTTWDGTTAPYTQTVTVTGILATDNPVVDVVLSSTPATALLEAAAWGKISRIVTAANSITAYCNEEAPAQALNIQLKVVR